jgi:hypothetical protein
MFLFVFSQTHIVLHAISHITDDIEHSQPSGSEQSVAHALCEQCIANAQADTANVPTIFYLSPSNGQHLLATIFVANITLRLPKLYSVRAPPTSLIA